MGRELSPEARQVLRQAADSDQVYVLALLEAAGDPGLTAEVRQAATRTPHALVERRPDGSLRLHDTPEEAEQALLALAARLADDGPITVRHLVDAARSDARLVGLDSEGPAPGESDPAPADPGELTAWAPFPVAGRRREVAALLARLARRTNPAAALVGPPRSGRRSTVLALCNALGGHSDLAVPPPLCGARVVEIEPATFAAQLRVGVEAYVDQGTILYLHDGDPHWVLTQVPGRLRRRLRFIARMTGAAWHQSLDRADGGLDYLAPPVLIDEPATGDLRAMVEAQAADLAADCGEPIEERVVDLALQWVEHRKLRPSAAVAVELLDEYLGLGPGGGASGVDRMLEVVSRRSEPEAAHRWYFALYCDAPNGADAPAARRREGGNE